MSWPEIILFFIAQTGLYVWLGKRLIVALIERDADKFRANLRLEGDTQIERLKSSLQLIAFEQQVRFSRLHARRANIIAELYKLLNEVPAVAKGFIFGAPSDVDRERTAREKVYELYNFVENHRIYLPPHVCDLLDKFSTILRHSVIFVSVYWTIDTPNDATRQEQNRVIKEAVSSLETEVPSLKKDLEMEFRKLLGDLDGTPKA